MSSRATLILVGGFAIFALILTVSLVQAIGNLPEPADVLGDLIEQPAP